VLIRIASFELCYIADRQIDDNDDRRSRTRANVATAISSAGEDENKKIFWSESRRAAHSADLAVRGRRERAVAQSIESIHAHDRSSTYDSDR
jgi:hypothetical protein